MSLSEHAERNRRVWTGYADEYAASAERAWAQDEITWGVWHVPEAELRVLPDAAGKDIVELGCGTAYISAWLARRGARPADDEAVEFHLGYGDWIRLLRANGLDVLDLIEVRPAEDASPHRSETLPDLEWARKWPSEEIWVARKR